MMYTARVSAGCVTTELVDRNNKAIPEFSRQNCAAFVDSVGHELGWKTAAFPKKLIDRDRKVRFYIKNSDLYSYLAEGRQFADRLQQAGLPALEHTARHGSQLSRHAVEYHRPPLPR